LNVRPGVRTRAGREWLYTNGRWVNAFPAGGLPITLRSALAGTLAAAPFALLAASSEPVVVIVDQQRREITPLVRGEAELIALADLLQGLPVTQTPEPRGGAITLQAEGRRVTLYDRKSLASVDGDLRLLSSNVLLESGRWLVPVDSVPRLLAPLLRKRAEWRAAQRTLLVGNVSVPRITVSTILSGDAVRVVLESSEKVPFRVAQEQGRVTVAIPRDVVDVTHQTERLTGGIVDQVQFLGGRDNVFAVTLGRRFKDLKAQEGEAPPRLILEFHGPPLAAAETGPSTASSETAAPRAAPEPAAVRTVVIDPGHGGDDVGAQGPGGTLEKDVTLAIARKVRAGVANTLGVQAFLTRDKDQEVALDERAAFANNYKSDLFISIHANASRAQGARGAEVYFLSYQASDDESRRLAAMEGGEVPAGAPAPPGSDVALILWDMAQAEHLEESSALASRIQEELAEVTGSQGRGVKQAPFRVLVGAAMPAVLVEVAFISNSEEEKLLTSEAYQGKVAAAVVRGIARFQQELTQRARATQRGPGVGTGAGPVAAGPKS
jgi:N-acetylmuramoyl-L-alanine amidase